MLNGWKHFVLQLVQEFLEYTITLAKKNKPYQHKSYLETYCGHVIWLKDLMNIQNINPIFSTLVKLFSKSLLKLIPGKKTSLAWVYIYRMHLNFNLS